MQIVRFLLVGLCNTVVGLVSIYGAMFLFQIDYRVANAIGYTIGGIIAFLLNRSWTFGYEGSLSKSLVRWLAVVGVAYGCNLAAVIALHQGFGADPYAAQLAGIAVYSATAYSGGRFYAFRMLRSVKPEVRL